MAAFSSRVNRGLRPQTMAAYLSKFRLYLVFLAHLQFSPPDSFQAVAMFIEYLAQQGLRAQTVTNYVSVLSHYFTLYGLDTSILTSKLYSLAIKAVAHNAPLSFKVKGILSISKLRQLVGALHEFPDHKVYTTICLMAFFGFYRLATLVPPSQAAFSPARYLTHGDIIWGSPGAHVIIKYAKNMQISGHSRVVQLPALSDPLLYPVRALKHLVSSSPQHRDAPLFTVNQNGVSTVLAASKVRLSLRRVVASLGWDPREYGFHTFRRSGASWAYDNSVALDYIKTHGGWSSDAIWRYLIKTPHAAGTVARTFQERLS